jgi:hypothetical protein
MKLDLDEVISELTLASNMLLDDISAQTHVSVKVMSIYAKMRWILGNLTILNAFYGGKELIEVEKERK